MPPKRSTRSKKAADAAATEEEEQGNVQILPDEAADAADTANVVGEGADAAPEQDEGANEGLSLIHISEPTRRS